MSIRTSFSQRLNRYDREFLRLTFRNRPASLIYAELEYLMMQLTGIGRAKLLAVIEHFVPPEDRATAGDRRRLMKKLLYAKAYYAVRYKEYFLFDFEHLTENERREFVGWYEMVDCYIRLEKDGKRPIFNSKEKTYAAFRDYFKRDAVYIPDSSCQADFVDFLKQHGAAVLKPVGTFGGAGIRKLDLAEGLEPEAAFAESVASCPFILEELIRQSPEMSAFYPHSVNTVRYNTFLYNDKLYRLRAYFRMGRGGSFVDNATSGGIYTLVDTDTGIIQGPARSFAGELYEQHPDTGMQLDGSPIPHWAELNELLERIARVLPEQKQVGWDFALSEQGWVLVEGNTHPDLQCLDLSHGLRPLLRDTFGQAVRMWDQ